MRSVLFIVLAALSLGVCLLSFGILFASCAGHPPSTSIGAWILPVSLISTGLSFYLTPLFWRLRREDQAFNLVEEIKKLMFNTFRFFVAATAFAVSIFIFTVIITSIVVATTMPGWALFVLYVVELVISVYIARIVSRVINKLIANKFPNTDMREQT